MQYTYTHSTGFQMQNSIIMFYLEATIVHVQHIHTQEERTSGHRDTSIIKFAFKMRKTRIKYKVQKWSELPLLCSFVCGNWQYGDDVKCWRLLCLWLTVAGAVYPSYLQLSGERSSTEEWGQWWQQLTTSQHSAQSIPQIAQYSSSARCWDSVKLLHVQLVSVTCHSSF